MQATADTITDDMIRRLESEFPPGSTEAYWCGAALNTRAEFPLLRRRYRDQCARIWNEHHA